MSLSDWNIAKAIVFVDIPKLILWRKIDSSPKKTFIKTISGPIVSVSDAVGGPPESLVANIDLTQEGSGDPSPDTYTALGPSDIVSFTAAADDRIKNFAVNIEPAQSGSGDPSPDNVRPITGRTGASVTRTGVNIFGGTLMRDGIKAALPSATIDEDKKYISFASNAGAIQNFTAECGLTGKFKEATRYTFIMSIYKTVGTGSNMRVYYTDGSYAVIPAVSEVEVKETVVLVTAANKTVSSITKTNSSGATRVYYEESGIFEGVLTADDFVPYGGTTYDITFPSEAGIIYGGTLDVLTGTLTVDRGFKTFSSADGWTLLQRGLLFHENIFGMNTPTAAGAGNGFASNMYLQANVVKNSSVAANQPSGTFFNQYVSTSNHLDRCYIRNDAITTIEEFGAALAANPLQVTYPLDTPVTYQLTLQEITTLLGANNIWADCGQTSLTHVAPGNIRPITGVSSISVHPAGASAEYTYESGGLNDSGEESTSSSYHRSTYIDAHGANNVYMQYSSPSGAWVIRVCAYNKDKEFLSLMHKRTHSATSTWNATLTIPDDAAYIRFSTKFSATMDICVFDYSNVQLTLSSEVYSGNVKFNKDGSADIYCDKQYCVLDGNSVISEYYAATDSTRMGCIFANVLPFAAPKVANQTGLIANWAVRETTASKPREKNVSHWSVRSSNSGGSKDLYLYAPYGMEVTESELLEMLTDNPLQVVIPIATPRTYHIDAEDVPDITLFQGKNTLWSDTGDVELTYEAESE